MAVVNGLNQKHGARAVVFGSMGAPKRLERAREVRGGAPRWEMRRERMSQRYTTRWDELSVARVL